MSEEMERDMEMEQTVPEAAEPAQTGPDPSEVARSRRLEVQQNEMSSDDVPSAEQTHDMTRTKPEPSRLAKTAKSAEFALAQGTARKELKPLEDKEISVAEREKETVLKEADAPVPHKELGPSPAMMGPGHPPMFNPVATVFAMNDRAQAKSDRLVSEITGIDIKPDHVPPEPHGPHGPHHPHMYGYPPMAMAPGFAPARMMAVYDGRYMNALQAALSEKMVGLQEEQAANTKAMLETLQRESFMAHAWCDMERRDKLMGCMDEQQHAEVEAIKDEPGRFERFCGFMRDAEKQRQLGEPQGDDVLTRYDHLLGSGELGQDRSMQGAQMESEKQAEMQMQQEGSEYGA